LDFFSNFFKKKPIPKDQENPSSKFLPKKRAVIEERFILNFIKNGGKFLYCETIDEVRKNFNLILNENKWIENDILMIKLELNKKYRLITSYNSSLDLKKCFVTDCENLIASNGSILISSNQIYEKKLSKLPKNFIIITDTRKLKNNISEGLAHIKSKGENIPTNITAIKNFSTNKEDKNFLSYGTSSKNLYLILLEKGFN
tara:strand:- start:828 stop:1430 length:603 start_codon:yes stop_codon:yes gene_type:complete